MKIGPEIAMQTRFLSNSYENNSDAFNVTCGRESIPRKSAQRNCSFNIPVVKHALCISHNFVLFQVSTHNIATSRTSVVLAAVFKLR